MIRSLRGSGAQSVKGSRFGVGSSRVKGFRVWGLGLGGLGFRGLGFGV